MIQMTLTTNRTSCRLSEIFFHGVLILGTLASLHFRAPHVALGQESGSPARVPDWDEIERRIKTSIQSPRSISQADVGRERQQVSRIIQRVESRLANDPNRELWRAYLRLDEMTAAAQPDVIFDEYQWAEFCDQMWKARAVWPDSTIGSLQESVQRYARISRVFSDPDYRTVRAERMNELLENIQSYSKTPNDEVLRRIGEINAWLTLRDDAVNVVDALNARFQHPNVTVSFSPEVFRREFSRTIDETFPIRDVYSGTYVYGNGTLKGTLEPRVTNTNGHGSLTIALSAQIHSLTSGASRGVSVSTSGNTTVTGSKVIVFDGFSVRTLPATASAQSAVQINGINAPGGRYGREARSQVYGSRWQAEQQARASAERFARTRMDEFASQPMSRLNNRIREDLLTPVASNNMLPRTVFSSSSQDQLEISGVIADWPNWGAPTEPPAANPAADATLMIHQSALEHGIGGKLRGRRLNESEFLRELSLQDADSTTTPTEEDPDFEESESQTQLSFDAAIPMEVQLDQDQIIISLRLAELESAGTTYPGVDMTLTYDVRLSDDNVTLLRTAEPEVLPSKFEAEEGKRLTGPQQVLRKTLIRRIARSIPKVQEMKNLGGVTLELPEMKIKKVRTEQGWLLVELESRPGAKGTDITKSVAD